MKRFKNFAGFSIDTGFSDIPDAYIEESIKCYLNRTLLIAIFMYVGTRDNTAK